MDRGLIVEGLIIGALVVGGVVQTLRLHDEQAAHAKTKAAHAEQIAQLERAAATAERDYRTKEGDWREQIRLADEAGKQRIIQANAAAAAADASRERMRSDTSRFLAAYRGAAASAAGDAGKREALDAAERVFADLQRRYDEAAGRVESFADRAYSEALTCWDAARVGREKR